MKPLLVLDAYLDERGGGHDYERLLAGRPLETRRTIDGDLPADASPYAGLIVSGSAASVLEPPPWLAPTRALVADALARDVPVLGVCFGHQVLAQAAFGPRHVRRAPASELGWVDVQRVGADPLLDALPRRFRCFVSHLDEVAGEPPGLVRLARSARCAVQALRVAGARAWGVQFHPEMLPDEAERLVRSAAHRHPHVAGDVEAVLRERVDGEPLGRALLGRFATLCLEPAAWTR